MDLGGGGGGLVNKVACRCLLLRGKHIRRLLALTNVSSLLLRYNKIRHSQCSLMLKLLFLASFTTTAYVMSLEHRSQVTRKVSRYFEGDEVVIFQDTILFVYGQ